MVLTRFRLDVWLDCVAALGVADRDRSEAIATFHRLDRAYGQTGRAYHNQAHIDACLGLCAEWRSQFHHPAAVEMAIWFHDAVYVPRRADNEARSARWAEAVLRRWRVDAEVRSWVVSAILATQHLATQNLATQHDAKSRQDSAHDFNVHHDRTLLLDIDLSILAASTLEFSRYEAAIRREYDFVSEEAFRVGRLAVLRSFLDRDRLFQSAIGFARFEARARQNLVSAIARSSIDPNDP